MKSADSENVKHSTLQHFEPKCLPTLLGDFGEAFAPEEFRYGKDCSTPLAVRPPEARFEPQAPVSYSADIWSLATTILDILGMKAISAADLPPQMRW